MDFQHLSKKIQPKNRIWSCNTAFSNWVILNTPHWIVTCDYVRAIFLGIAVLCHEYHMFSIPGRYCYTHSCITGCVCENVSEVVPCRWKCFSRNNLICLFGFWNVKQNTDTISLIFYVRNFILLAHLIDPCFIIMCI